MGDNAAVTETELQSTATKDLVASSDRGLGSTLMLAGVGVLLVTLMYQPTLDSLHMLPWNLGDPALNTWILSWESHAIISEPGRFFQGNIFHPFGHALKYTELMLPLLPGFGLVLALSGNPVLAYSLTSLGLSVFCFMATHRLALRLVGALPALIAAASFSFSGYVFMHQSHLQLVALGFFPLAFLALFRMLDRRRIRDGVWLGVCTCLLTTAAFYYGAIWFVCMGAIVIADLVRRRWPDRAWWRSVGVAAAISAVVLGPLAIVYSSFQTDVSFFRDPIGFELRPLDFLTPAPGSVVFSGLSDWATARRDTGPVEHGFFMGFVIPVLALGGAGSLLTGSVAQRRDRTRLERNQVEMWWMILAGSVAVSIAIGPRLFGVPLPLHFLREYVPGFDAMRAVSRLAVPALLTTSLLAAWCLGRLVHRRSLEARLLILAIATSVVLVEMYVEPMNVPVPAPSSLNAALMNEGDGAVVELPMRQTLDAEFAIIEGPRLLASIGDWRPRFNGYSGDVPPGYMEFVERLNRFPSADSLETLQDLNIRYVILHGNEVSSESAYSLTDIQERLGRLSTSIEYRRYSDAWLVDLEPGS